MEFALPVGDQVRLGDLVDGELVRSAITLDLQKAIRGPPERPREIAATLHALREPKARALPRKPCKISLPPKGPIKPWRAHFQLIGMRNQIRDIERGREIPADALAIGVRKQRLPRLHGTIYKQADD